MVKSWFTCAALVVFLTFTTEVVCNKGLPVSLTIQVTPGDTVTLPATYNQHEHVIALTWNKMDERIEGTRTPVFLYSVSSRSSLSLGPLKDRALLNKNGSLTILNVTVKDEGQYVMTVLIDAVGQQEHYVYLDVLAPPLVTVGLQSPLRVSLRSSVILNCTVEKTSSTDPSIFWLRDGQPLPPATVQLVIDGQDVYRSSLMMQSVGKADSGNYTCVAQQGRSWQTDSLSLVVVYPAAIVNVTGPVKVKAGGTALLWCTADGNPTPEVYWQKDGSDDILAAAMYHGTAGSLLVLPDLNVKDSDHYICTASNALGQPDKRIVPVIVIEESSLATTAAQLGHGDETEWTAILGGAAGGATILLIILLVALVFTKRAKIEAGRSDDHVFSVSDPVPKRLQNNFIEKEKLGLPKDEEQILYVQETSGKAVIARTGIHHADTRLSQTKMCDIPDGSEDLIQVLPCCETLNDHSIT
ncbi:hemicentin-1-like [Branchiostoma floridae]|uniref:Hemicentin-1-like n=1 Tax=Branchiostoma floridae TaxID=7739 RepID=A0A9J7MC18_BRAFL|nr:hemicentin-1-like [Branchiostoma floridae]